MFEFSFLNKHLSWKCMRLVINFPERNCCYVKKSPWDKAQKEVRVGAGLLSLSQLPYLPWSIIQPPVLTHSPCSVLGLPRSSSWWSVIPNLTPGHYWGSEQSQDLLPSPPLPPCLAATVWKQIILFSLQFIKGLYFLLTVKVTSQAPTLLTKMALSAWRWLHTVILVAISFTKEPHKFNLWWDDP